MVSEEDLLGWDMRLGVDQAEWAIFPAIALIESNSNANTHQLLIRN